MKAVVLAAGRGSRMRRPAGGSALAPEQRRAAERGCKTLVPFHGRPFLEYLLTAAADGGVTEFCLVVGPGPEDPVRAHVESLRPTRFELHSVEQTRPRGTADALARARAWAGDDPLLVLNADNLFPAAAIAAVGALPGHGLAGFRPAGLVAGGLDADRLLAFALLRADARGCLEAIVEKPTETERRALEDGPEVLVSMTLWRFEAEIFEACERIVPSSRHELELPDAVRWLVHERARCVRVLPVEAQVLDLTWQGDVGPVEAALEGREVRL